MIEKYVGPGDKVDLHPRHRGMIEDKAARKGYKSRVNQVLDEDKIEILMPIEQSKIVLLPKNARFDMVLYTSHGLYQCEVKVGERHKSGNIYLQVVELLSGMKRFQRREYYRYSCSVPIFCRKLLDNEKDTLVWDENLKGKEGNTLDIGGGGARFLIDEEFQPGDLVICHMPLEIKNVVNDIQGLGKILSVKPVKNTDTFEVRVQYEIMAGSMREQIIQYIFEDERKRRKHNNGL